MGSLVAILVFFLMLIAICAGIVMLFKMIMDNAVKKAAETDHPEKSLPLLKKYSYTNISNYTRLFMNLGLTISLGFIVLAFEYKSYDDGSLVDLGQVDDNFEDLMEIPLTEQPPPPPPKIQLPQIIEVPDEEEIEDEIDVEIDVEIAEETVIEDVVFDEAPEEEVADEIFTIVEDQPEPIGGMRSFYEYVGKRLKYPNQARRMGIEGKVFVQFVVDKDGKLNDVQAVKGIGAGCDEEAVRVISGAPNWKPGKQRGRPVKVRMILPITFKLG